MQIKKLLLVVIATIGFTVTGIQAVDASVNYTDGMPKQLVGKYWRTKIKYGTGRDGYPKGYPKFIYAHATKHTFWVKASRADGLGLFTNASYYKDGTRHWYLAGDNPNAGGDFKYFDVKLSKTYKTLAFSNLFTDDTWDSHRTFTKAYRFYHFPRWHGHAAR